MKDDELWTKQPLEIDVPADTVDGETGQRIPSGVIVFNEGRFTYSDASLSFYDIEGRAVINDAFYTANALPLGDVAQSVAIIDSLGYAVLNNSGKIYAFDLNTFELKGKITGLTSPRYILPISETKAYVTDLKAQRISIVDPQSFTVTGSISVRNTATVFKQHATEQMVRVGDTVFVACWSFDNTILVIDTKTDALVDSVTVGLQPNSIVLDKNDKLWVLGDGGFEGNPFGYEQPTLQCIDVRTLDIVYSYCFPLEDSPSELCMNGTADTLYFINKHVYRMPANLEATPSVCIQSTHTGSMYGGFYGLGVDPYRSEIYVADALDLSQAGVVYRYSSTIQPIDTFKVGVIPGGFCFR